MQDINEKKKAEKSGVQHKYDPTKRNSEKRKMECPTFVDITEHAEHELNENEKIDCPTLVYITGLKVGRLSSKVKKHRTRYK